MSLTSVRFAVVMLAALSLSVAVGHLLQLPARLAWDQYLWVGATVQGGFFGLSGPLGVLLQVVALIAMIVLAALARSHGDGGFTLTTAAAVLFAIGLLAWWILVYPANVESPNGSTARFLTTGPVGARDGSGARPQMGSRSSWALPPWCCR